MKNTILINMLFFATAIFAQDKMITKNGIITFEASVPAFEAVNAINEGVSCVLNSKTGKIASLALMKGFRFKIAMMERHFNDNYVQSKRYPKAMFKGKIDGFDVTALTADQREYIMQGKLEIHGRYKNISTTAKIRRTDLGIEIISNFIINADDFAITIPIIVKSKVSNKINILTAFVVK